MIVSHILAITWISQVGTSPPFWDLLTWLGVGTSCEPALTRDTDTRTQQSKYFIHKIVLQIQPDYCVYWQGTHMDDTNYLRMQLYEQLTIRVIY